MKVTTEPEVISAGRNYIQCIYKYAGSCVGVSVLYVFVVCAFVCGKGIAENVPMRYDEEHSK